MARQVGDRSAEDSCESKNGSNDEESSEEDEEDNESVPEKDTMPSIKNMPSSEVIDENSTAKKEGDVTLEITDNRKAMTINDLPLGQNKAVVCYGNVNMPGKLYVTTLNIQSFVENKLMSEWKITFMWTAWLMKANPLDVNSKVHVRSLVEQELGPLMLTVDHTGILQIAFHTVYQMLRDYDGKKKVQNDILSTDDRRFLHLLVGSDEFKDTNIVDLVFYVKEYQCHLESVRLMKKYDSRNEIDTDVIEQFWNPCTNRRFCEIVIFNSQFFGRAEHVMVESKVKDLWNTLPFVNDFMKGLVEQCQIKGKLQKTHDAKEVIKKQSIKDQHVIPGLCKNTKIKKITKKEEEWN